MYRVLSCVVHEGIEGSSLPDLTLTDMADMGMADEEQRCRLLAWIDSVKGTVVEVPEVHPSGSRPT